MDKLHFFISVAAGQISVVLSLLAAQPQTPKIQKVMTALKAGSAALTSIISDAP